MQKCEACGNEAEPGGSCTNCGGQMRDKCPNCGGAMAEGHTCNA